MMMKRILRAPDAYPLALLLAFVGGYLDAYTYITRDGVFANAQTGNMALMALRLARGEWADALHYLVPIAAFALGIFGVREARYHMRKKGRSYHKIALAAEILILVWVSFIPQGAMNPLANVLVSLVCALQVGAFKTIGGQAYASTMCTGNLRSATEHLHDYLRSKNPAALTRSMQYFGVILIFILGALLGGLITPPLGIHSTLICCAALLIALIVVKNPS